MASPLNSKDRIKEETHFEDATTKQRREADKAFFTQKNNNELLFIAKNYIELDFIINQVRNLIQQLEEEKKIVVNENEKLHHQQKNQEKFNESIKKYNEALQQIAVSEPKPENIALTTKWEDLINKIQQDLARLMTYIQSLDRVIHKVQLKIAEIKKNFSDQIKQIFTESNPNLNFLSRNISFMIPAAERHEMPGADRFQGNITLDKSSFIQLAHGVADNFSNGEIKFEDLENYILLQAKKMIHDRISSNLSIGMPNLSSDKKETIIKSLLKQNKIKHEIEAVRIQLYDALSKHPAVASALVRGQQLEEKEKSLMAVKEAAIAKKKDVLETLTEGFQSLQPTAAEVSKAIIIAEKAYNDLEQTTAALESATHELPSLENSLDFLKPSEPAPTATSAASPTIPSHATTEAPEVETIDDENKNERPAYRP